ncbi:hypothetical protein FOPG_18074 [Fusarium oxysporum f. sp. conglutinans race 2 54008]|uniref:Uncharacterized protein n=3 Tax=Fusarium oxysporum f. sp. conglutinans TaxID=100902 RepID=A0A8H6LLU8_FUSOX|nr:hypothetical protein FOXB_16210 [Fusarium oxysporum f. sp. conglutinans Fo5176]EXL65704.1 hypothetical protein FOPG_18074 [Fusarium oxysporum f. sp. conglutinans race 2 54008]KAF6525647.1 hypothetical protein HZS61_011442 [Fusarium oxysporum f. sp. conglutinans]KAG6996968.1 hypothetical protein FocnCong_v015137 [Fusarium oxysporum f. sp. conglutinans]KAI8411155.1 hypothetical protein FOFC_07749 [Fusarium oxysporum]
MLEEIFDSSEQAIAGNRVTPNWVPVQAILEIFSAALRSSNRFLPLFLYDLFDRIQDEDVLSAPLGDMPHLDNYDIKEYTHLGWVCNKVANGDSDHKCHETTCDLLYGLITIKFSRSGTPPVAKLAAIQQVLIRHTDGRETDGRTKTNAMLS